MSNEISHRKRPKGSEEKRSAILDAAVTVFSRKGFANARIEDIARQAGIGKGTVYLYFPDKESLFKSLVASAVEPILEHADRFLSEEDTSPRETMTTVYDMIDTHILQSEKRHIIRLMITEMSYFPDIAAYYHTNIVSRGLDLLRKLLIRADARGELRSQHALKVPQMVFAPVVMSVIWNALFARFESIDTHAAFQFYLDSLFQSADGA
ncbi:TetR/AcrR family transcriptional regulator [Martelella mediterranea]|uniref:TetR family transcriptional regulator n=1 Tax=Martelella mediterranea TaxID=293089 RepID=A0A4R3NXQ4_9HYPH|nr:TetR/AcrR family transcriptional regulator [Martelella mediterranea]TCT37851.1 TetR family transcriptional regulator [Martelella mediterranea]